MKLKVVIMAAGEGTRMKSKTPKVLHRICGAPMISYVIESSTCISPDEVVLVLGKNSPVESVVPQRTVIVEQEKPLGTAHAILSAKDAISDADSVMILSGDTPLLQPDTLSEMVKTFEGTQSAATILTAGYDDPFGYGRILRGENGRLMGIVEELDASEEQKEIKEVNTGTYLFKTSDLLSALERVSNANAKEEYYLTDCIGVLLNDGKTLSTVRCKDADETMGINSREQLAHAELIVRQRIRRKWMNEGVTMTDPSSVYIERDVVLSSDVTIFAGTNIQGRSSVGEDSEIGPYSTVIDSKVGRGTKIIYSVLREVEIADGVNVGPFSYLRPGSFLSNGSKAGTFVEIKNSKIGKGSKVPHLSYIGDAEIGEDVNVGAGSITCNYDGMKKSKTEIDDRAFIGSDTMFVAPVRIGKDAVTGAGSVITEDIPDGALGISRPEQKNIAGYAERRKRKKTN